MAGNEDEITRRCLEALASSLKQILPFHHIESLVFAMMYVQRSAAARRRHIFDKT